MRRRGSSSVSAASTSMYLDSMLNERVPPHKQVHVKLDMDMFEPALLRDEKSLESALCALEGHLQASAAGVERTVRALMERPHLFEFVFSALPEDRATAVVHSIIDNFPSEARSFTTSLASSLLYTLSLYFWSLEYPSPSLLECHRAVDLAKPVLKALSDEDIFSDSDLAAEGATSAMEAEEDGFLVKKQQKQRDRKKNRRTLRSSVSLDTKPFQQLGIPVPLTKAQAREQAEHILGDQKRILQHYLKTLREPVLAVLVKAAFLPSQSAEDGQADTSDEADKTITIVSTSELPAEIPTAYPLIQPMKAAFHFDSVDGFGEWRILVSTRADRNLREAKKSDQKLFAIILKKIKELSNGHFSDDNQKKLTGKDVGVPIFEAKMTRDTRLVYQVDCVREFETEIDRQVLRIFGIYTHAQLERRFWDAVGQHLAGKGKEYRKRCIFRKAPKNAGDKVFLPESFPPSKEPDVPERPVRLPDLRDEDREELHSLLVLQKFVTFSQALLNSILADQDVQHVFHMSPAEQAIVKHNGSCYVLGRSGTGKTTTMLFKMLGIERAWDAVRSDVSISRPRQVFVTQSRVLAEKVEEYYKKLTESHVAATRSTEESVLLGATKEKPEDRALVDQDEEELWHGSLPKRFSDLADEHFPLFVTFDHLCRLLEEDFRTMNKLAFTLLVEDNHYDPSSIASDYMLQRRESFVSYGTFLQAYWPHLPQNLTKTLDPALVFAEIMGVIKGSEEALQSEEGFLDARTYVSLSHRQQGTFASRREAVHTVFLAYVKLKRERRDWDAADRTRAILNSLQEIGVPGKKLDFIYIDEAQDNLLIDALVIKTLCKNPEGLFWAGDTAQTISAGSSFRFDDLKAFLYRLEAKSISHGLTVKTPEAFQLNVNYRSHGGIVGCAHSVVQLIARFWPHAIDSLAEEKGVVDGLKPVFFSGWDQDTVQYEQFLFGASGRQIEFGAQQCILVRDDDARNKLQAQMGDIGLILTLYESKGLEFNDVLLYNFFEDSTVEVSQWRVILNALAEKKHLRCPTFDDTRHSGVCRELKFLYVAITRARKNLWIADCSDKGEPLRMFWTTYDLVKNCSAADEVPRLATSSTPAEWAATARTLFDNRRYLQAVRCYERAGLYREKEVGYAYYLREQARSTIKTRRTTDNSRIIAFASAAKAFLRSASMATTRKETLAYYRNAAECFVEADDDHEAAKAYLSAEEFTRSAQHYRKAGSFDEAVHVVQAHRQHISPVDAEVIIDVAKLYYVKENRLDRATGLFETFEAALEFMEDYGFDVARATLLETSGRLSEAAELHLLEGRPIRAIQLFMQDKEDVTSQQRAQECILDGLWQHLPISTVPTEGSEKAELVSLLKLADELLADPLIFVTPHVKDQFAMFQAIALGKTANLQELGERFLSVHHDGCAALRCLDHIFYGKPVAIQSANPPDAVTLLYSFFCYVRELQRVALEQQPAQDQALRWLFGIHPVEGTENSFSLPPRTLLHGYHHRRQTRGTNSATHDDDLHEPVTLNSWELATLFQSALHERLKRSVTDENVLCTRARSLIPCPTLLVFGHCYARECSRVHWNGAPPELSDFKIRVQIIFQQILIYQTISSLEDREIVTLQRRSWLSALYHTLYPAHYKLGASPLLDLTSIPESDKAIQVIKEWVRDCIYSLNPRSEPQHFLTSITELTALAYVFDKSEAQQYIHRARCVGDSGHRLHELTRGKEKDRYIVYDLIELMDGSSENALSAGVLFLQSVVENHLALDVNVLCQILEYICALFVLSHRLRRYGTIHDITLTRRWMLSFFNDSTPREQDVKLLGLFLRPMRSLMNEVYFGKAAFLLYNRGRRIDNQIRNMMAARICRSLCLLGYNICDYKTRDEIRRVITSIHQPAKSYPRIVRRYTKAIGWNDLVKALRNSASEEQSELDELIQLKDSTRTKELTHSIRGVRFVQYNDPSDIIPVMNGEEVKSPPKSKLRPEAAPFIPARSREPEVNIDDEEDDEEDDDDDEPTEAQQEEDAGIDHSVDLDAVAQKVDAARVEQVFAPPTEDEIRAARLISSFYRRSRSHKQDKPKKGLPVVRYRWFIACQAKSPDMRRFYRLLFLGPLPHALVCAEKLDEYSNDVRKKALLRMQVAMDAELEKVKTEVDNATKSRRAIANVKKLLVPSSDVHKQQNTEELKKQLLALEQLSASVQPDVSKVWDWDLKMALKGIVQERASPKKKLKPELVIDNDDDEYYY